MKRYKKEDVIKIAELLGQLTLILRSNPYDFLGSIFMELEFGNKDFGQVFTPPQIHRLMIQLSCSDFSILDDQPYLAVHEPSCGSAGAVIELSEYMKESGYSPQHQLFASCIDNDSTAAYMAYIQLSILDIPAEIIIGNTLTMDLRRTMYTPAFVTNEWNKKLTKEALQDNAVSSLMQLDQLSLAI